MYIPTFDGVPTLGVGMGGGVTPKIGRISGFGGGSGPASAPDADIGDMKMAARVDDHPEGSMTWMLCDGRAIDRLAYAQLFAIIAINYGPGDGLTTFNIPQFATGGGIKGRFPALGLGVQVGQETHGHNLPVPGPAPWDHNYNPNDNTSDTGAVQAFDLPNDVLAAGALHHHDMPAVGHTGGPYATDAMAADAINPYVAVGFFMRVL